MSRRLHRSWRWPARALAVAGSGLALWLVLRRLDLAALATTLRTIHLGWYLAAMFAFGLGLLGSALRWHLMLRLNHEAVVHGAASVRMVFIGQFFNTIFGGPSGGDVPKTALYSRWFGVPAADVLAASVLDRLLSSVGGMIFAVVAVSIGAATGAFRFFDRWEWRLPGPTLVLAAAAVVVVVGALLAWARHRPASFAGRSWSALRKSVGQLLRSRRRSAHALACAIATAILFNLAQVLCLRAVSPGPIPVGHLLWVYHLVTAVAAMPITVAGAGLREGASMFLLGQYDIPATRAVAAALLTLTLHVTWALAGAVLLVREQRARARARCPRAERPASLSVVVPVLNEAAALPETVARLRAVPEVGEILVVDGGSTDGTPDVAARLGCRVLATARGRGLQMRTGAAEARGGVVWFVHADTWVPPESGAAMLRCLRDPLVVGGGFWKRFRNPPWIMRGSRFRCWLRLWWNGRVLGDQALFVRREALEAAGGVPEQPLMEEIELCRRLRRLGRLALAGAPVTTSERRFLKHGVLRTYWLMWRVARAYKRGVTPAELARIYEDR